MIRINDFGQIWVNKFSTTGKFLPGLTVKIAILRPESGGGSGDKSWHDYCLRSMRMELNHEYQEASDAGSKNHKLPSFDLIPFWFGTRAIREEEIVIP
jgi:hypothetical protein